MLRLQRRSHESAARSYATACRVGQGNESALDELMPLVYTELRRMSACYMGLQNPGHTFQPTALINEAYIRLAGDSPKQWENRAHFFGSGREINAAYSR